MEEILEKDLVIKINSQMAKKESTKKYCKYIRRKILYVETGRSLKQIFLSSALNTSHCILLQKAKVVRSS